jgi:hypothetical protein
MTAPKEDSQNADDLNFELRQNINDAYAFVEGAKSNQMFSTVTFEDLMDQQISTLTGPDTESRPNPLHRIDRIQQNLQTTIDQIKKLPPEVFQLRDDTDSVNTPVDGDDPYNDGTQT